MPTGINLGILSFCLKDTAFSNFRFFDLIQFSESLDCVIVKIYQTLLFISRLDPGQYFAGLFVILNKNKIKKS